MSLHNKHIIVGVTGGIAAYKSADLVRRLREAGADVRVVMTTHAKAFITPLTMQAVSAHPVHEDLFDPAAEAAMGHIELARWADAIVIAPATADVMARLARGEAQDLLTTLCLATPAPLLIAPAMNQEMWKDAATQANVQTLQDRGIGIVGPEAGSQACGDVGLGRMSEPLSIVAAVAALFRPGVLQGLRVVITAGPTREMIDPVRYISNASSGKMGYALAEACVEAGALVQLISGPVALATPSHVSRTDVVSAEAMYESVHAVIQNADLFISVAAVADYRAKEMAKTKIAKTDEEMALTLIRNPDIVASVAALAKRPFVVGFAAETDQVLQKAQQKLQRKKVDMIIANAVNDKGLGFDSDENAATVLWGDQQQAFATMSKTQLARALVNLIAKVRATSQLEGVNHGS